MSKNNKNSVSFEQFCSMFKDSEKFLNELYALCHKYNFFLNLSQEIIYPQLKVISNPEIDTLFEKINAFFNDERAYHRDINGFIIFNPKDINFKKYLKGVKNEKI
ncbi:MAG TPA: hypothetical protein VMZ91_00195 [Candidatus Paceibacterota bacterium]|nr:hypothetical protein [Candidatus Paceibacterota bacterium]